MEIAESSALDARQRPDRALAVLLALTALWYGWFVYRTSFASGGERVFCLFDDAMVSMTYARNLLEGHGLNWAREGEPVEGFTHPLWTAVMVAANALPLPLRLRSLPVQLLSLALLLVHVLLVRRLVRRHFAGARARTWLPAALLTAFCYPLAYWSLMGMETALQAVLTTASVLLALDAVERGRGRACGRHLSLWLLATASFLLRMDMIVMVAAVQAFVLAGGGLRREERGRWLAGLALFAAAAGGYELFRWLYFGDLLPNTYYLKLTGIPLGVRLLRGLDSLGEIGSTHLAVLLPVGVGVGLRVARGGGRRYVLPAAIFALQCAYSVWVGGDAWEMEVNVRANRFLAFALPQVFVLGNGLLNWVLDALDRRLDPAGQATGGAGRALGAYVAAVALLLANGLLLSPRAAENRRDLLVTARPLCVASHQHLYARIASLHGIASPAAVVATTWAGIPAYFGGFRMVDLLGYNDRRVARLPAQVALDEDTFQSFHPGHMKWDNDYVFAERRPDVFFNLQGIERPHRTMRRKGYHVVEGFWVRKGSPRIHAPAGASPARPSASVQSGGDVPR